MAIYGWEWIVVIAIVAILLIWGPDKLPKLARSIGQAKKEFETASKELTSLPQASGGEDILELAKKLNIDTKGKTKEEISREILEKAQQSGKSQQDSA